MAISKVENPADGSELTIVKGVVQQVSVKEITPADRFGNTHKFGVRVDDDWVNNINVKTKEGYDPQIRFNNGTQTKPDWQTLEVGDEVRLVVTENPYNGKTYYNGGTSKIKLVKKGAGKPAAQGNTQAKPAAQNASSGSSGGFKRDNSGVVAGNGFNAAKAFLKGKAPKDDQEFVDLAVQMIEIGKKLRDVVAKSDSSLDEFTVGARSGMALIAAAEWAKKVDDIESLALVILQTYVPALVSYAKDGKLPVAEGEDDVGEAEDAPSYDEFDQDIPF